MFILVFDEHGVVGAVVVRVLGLRVAGVEEGAARQGREGHAGHALLRGQDVREAEVVVHCRGVA